MRSSPDPDDPGRPPTGSSEQIARLLLVATPFLLASAIVLAIRLLG